ncbi:di-trans,poly-cis-decaprenylcistransferase [Candidatus Parcubacteria bacterium]|nr:di-trans,poly-cis-decaprenylcistransferase [Candidatus Parcubacteria bacterium]
MEKKDKKSIPVHVGIIMDGNRRWAKERNLPSIEGNAKGYKKMKLVGDWFFSQGVKILSVYAFSTENWNRSRSEVNYLMKLMKKALKDDFEEFNEREYRLLISGRIEELPGDLPEICQEAINKTEKNTKGILNICINYGGRAELIDAFKKIVSKNVTSDQIHEGMIRKYLYQSELPDPDIIVRTSGEERTSGFQLWQSVYSEFLFLKKYWPDFEKSDAEIIVNEYNQRKRRYGGDGE